MFLSKNTRKPQSSPKDEDSTMSLMVSTMPYTLLYSARRRAEGWRLSKSVYQIDRYSIDCRDQCPLTWVRHGLQPTPGPENVVTQGAGKQFTVKQQQEKYVTKIWVYSDYLISWICWRNKQITDRATSFEKRLVNDCNALAQLFGRTLFSCCITKSSYLLTLYRDKSIQEPWKSRRENSYSAWYPDATGTDKTQKTTHFAGVFYRARLKGAF